MRNTTLDFLTFCSKKINSKKHLTQEEEVELFYLMAERGRVGEKARGLLYLSQERFICSVALYYHNMFNTIDFDDLMQSGIEGFLNALNRFNPELGYHLDSFAIAYIRKYILAYIDKNKSIVKSHFVDNFEKKILADSKLTLKDILPSNDCYDTIEMLHRDSMLNALRSVLNEKELYIFKARMGLINGDKMSYDELGQLYNQNPETIRVIYNNKVLPKSKAFIRMELDRAA